MQIGDSDPHIVGNIVAYFSQSVQFWEKKTADKTGAVRLHDPVRASRTTLDYFESLQHSHPEWLSLCFKGPKRGGR
jgi:hypothetical protein